MHPPAISPFGDSLAREEEPPTGADTARRTNKEVFSSMVEFRDSLMRKADGVAVAPSFFSEDASANRASLRALEALTFEVIADGHAGVTSHAKGKLLRLLRSS